jgi:hypothetical protein
MIRLFLTTALSFSTLVLPLHGQLRASQSVASSQPEADLTPTTITAQPADPDPDNPIDPASLLPDLRPLSPEKASLLGGTISRLDRVQDKIAVQVFGGGKVNIFFDPRTHIFSNGAPATVADLRQGDRIYIDTVLDGSKVFARSINLKTAVSVGESQGVVVSYRADKQEVLVRDLLSPNPLKVRLDSGTRIIRDGHAATGADLVPGTLVAVKFNSQKFGSQKDGGGLAREMSILAVPGSNFTFAGEIVGLDLSTARLVINSMTDHKTYEIYLEPASVSVNNDLHLGAQVTVVTNFDGARYIARNVTVTK